MPVEQTERRVRINYAGKSLSPERAEEIDEAIGLGADVSYNGDLDRLRIGEAPRRAPSSSGIPSTLGHARDLEVIAEESRAVRGDVQIVQPAPLFSTTLPLAKEQTEGAALEETQSDFDQLLKLIEEHLADLFGPGNPDCQTEERAA